MPWQQLKPKAFIRDWLEAARELPSLTNSRSCWLRSVNSRCPLFYFLTEELRVLLM